MSKYEVLAQSYLQFIKLIAHFSNKLMMMLFLKACDLRHTSALKKKIFLYITI